MQPFLPLAAALAIGLMIGLERGWHERNLPEGTRVAGVRTFALIGLFGGFAGLLSVQYGIAFAAVGLVAICLALAAGYIGAARENHVFGITSLIAGLVCYVLGVAAVMDHTLEAVMAAVVLHSLRWLILCVVVACSWLRRIACRRARARSTKDFEQR